MALAGRLEQVRRRPTGSIDPDVNDIGSTSATANRHRFTTCRAMERTDVDPILGRHIAPRTNSKIPRTKLGEVQAYRTTKRGVHSRRHELQVVVQTKVLAHLHRVRRRHERRHSRARKLRLRHEGRHAREHVLASWRRTGPHFSLLDS